jgi:glycosyltransferase involved in cell wall biosynthesis
MRVAALTTGGNAPSARFRIRQLIPVLLGHGIEVTELPSFVSAVAANPLVKGLPSLKRALRPTDALWAGIKAGARLREVAAARHFEAVWLSKGLVPGTMTFESLLKRPFVLDVDDAIWLSHRFARRAVPALVRRAKIVFAGNSWIKACLEEFSTDIRLIPTVVDTTRFRPAGPRPSISTGRSLIVGWSGTSSNFQYLHMIEGVLHQFLSGHNAILRIVSDRQPRFQTLSPAQVEFVPWTESNEVSLLQGLDIGLMPLGDDVWARGKCGLKLLTYLACGVPVIASPVSANGEILANGSVGLSADGPDAWMEGLRVLSADPELRQTMGSAGRALVEDRYSIEVVAPRIAEAFQELSGARSILR